ncbi:hypothetical protein SASPL_144444 [Salvia splendens]|uniref:Cationic amino acid transporter C-terminal domain-containing protein n=1 Tax=Salvia splendens TaxID=180675 RepID=A0A8X8WEU3_SALSN|nr:hypothetical protein SASPL_144444 [Salvia splendens]
MIPPFFALIHPKTGTPIYATLLTTLVSCTLALFKSLGLDVLSFSTLFIFMLMAVAVALLVRRYYLKDVTRGLARYPWLVSRGRGVSWAVGTVGMALTSQHRSAKVWGVPLVPWLPSLSIAMNIFLIGSLGATAIWRFLICSVVMVVYYVLVGVHTTYDVAHLEEWMINS